MTTALLTPAGLDPNARRTSRFYRRVKRANKASEKGTSH
jgi:hypothetical protein